MKNNIKRMAAALLAAGMMVATAPVAMAAEYYSGTLNVGGRVKVAQPETTPEPAAPVAPEAPEATVAPEATETPELIPFTPEETEETPAPEATAPETTEAPEATEEPAPETPAVRYVFERDENGALVLDENGNPIALLEEGMEVPVTFERDENGALVLDEEGNPIVKDTVPADAEILFTLEDRLNPERFIDVYLATDGEALVFGGEATLVAVLHGYDNAVYTLQWQTSTDNEAWTDVPDATESRMTVVVTEENYLNYWQIQVTITDVLESAAAAE